MGQEEKAETYLKQAIEIDKEMKWRTLPYSYYSLSIVLFKQKKTAEAGQTLKEGLKTAVKYDDNLFSLLTEFLYVLYAEPINQDSLVEILSKLENK